MRHRRMLMKDFLTDLYSGTSIAELMHKYALTAETFDRLCRKLNMQDSAIFQGLWLRGQLTESQFARAFVEPEDILRADRS